MAQANLCGLGGLVLASLALEKVVRRTTACGFAMRRGALLMTHTGEAVERVYDRRIP